jgi:hypothetical protein
MLYCNPGDWVDSCTAVVEDLRGRVSVVDWRGQQRPGGVTRQAPDRSPEAAGFRAPEVLEPAVP